MPTTNQEVMKVEDTSTGSANRTAPGTRRREETKTGAVCFDKPAQRLRRWIRLWAAMAGVGVATSVWQTFPVMRVLIETLDGRYLAGDQGGWWFTEERSKARVFDFLTSSTAREWDALQKGQGIVLLALPVERREIYETCNRCGRMVKSLRALFDGKQFLCPECRSNLSSAHSRSEVGGATNGSRNCVVSKDISPAPQAEASKLTTMQVTADKIAL